MPTAAVAIVEAGGGAGAASAPRSPASIRGRCANHSVGPNASPTSRAQLRPGLHQRECSNITGGDSCPKITPIMHRAVSVPMSIAVGDRFVGCHPGLPDIVPGGGRRGSGRRQLGTGNAHRSVICGGRGGLGRGGVDADGGAVRMGMRDRGGGFGLGIVRAGELLGAEEGQEEGAAGVEGGQEGGRRRRSSRSAPYAESAQWPERRHAGDRRVRTPVARPVSGRSAPRPC